MDKVIYSGNMKKQPLGNSFGSIKTRYFKLLNSGSLLYYENEVAAGNNKPEKGSLIVDAESSVEKKEARGKLYLTVKCGTDTLSCVFSMKDTHDVMDCESWFAAIKNLIERKKETNAKRLSARQSQSLTSSSFSDPPSTILNASNTSSSNINSSTTDISSSNYRENQILDKTATLKPPPKSRKSIMVTSNGSLNSVTSPSPPSSQSSPTSQISQPSQSSSSTFPSSTSSSLPLPPSSPSVRRSVNFSSNPYLPSPGSSDSPPPSSTLPRQSSTGVFTRQSSTGGLTSRSSSLLDHRNTIVEKDTKTGFTEDEKLFTGYLTKWPTSGGTGSRTRRYFVLQVDTRPSELSYYENEKYYKEGKKAKGKMILHSTTSICWTKKLGTNVPTFSINYQNETLSVRADTNEEDTQWIEILNKVVNANPFEIEERAKEKPREELKKMIFFNPQDSNIVNLLCHITNHRQMEVLNKKKGINLKQIKLIGMENELRSIKKNPQVNGEVVDFQAVDLSTESYNYIKEDTSNICYDYDVALLSLPLSNRLVGNGMETLAADERLNMIKNIIHSSVSSGCIKHIVFLSFVSSMGNDVNESLHLVAEEEIKAILSDYGSKGNYHIPQLSILRLPLVWDKLVNFHRDTIMRDGILYNCIAEDQKFYIANYSDIFEATIKVLIKNPFIMKANVIQYHNFVSKTMSLTYQDFMENLLKCCPILVKNARDLGRFVPLQYIQLPKSVLLATSKETRSTGNIDVEIFFSGFSQNINKTISEGDEKDSSSNSNQQDDLFAQLKRAPLDKNDWLLKHPSAFKMRSVLVFGATGLLGRSIVQTLSNQFGGMIKIHVLTRDSHSSQAQSLSGLVGVDIIDYLHVDRSHNPKLGLLLGDDDDLEEDEEEVAALFANQENANTNKNEMETSTNKAEANYKTSKILKAALQHKRYNALLIIPPLHPEMIDMVETVLPLFKPSPTRNVIMLSSPVGSSSYPPSNPSRAHANLFKKLESVFNVATSTSRTAKHGAIIRIPLLLETLLLPLTAEVSGGALPLLILPLLSTPTTTNTLFTPIALTDVANSIATLVNNLERQPLNGTTYHLYRKRISCSEIALALSRSIDTIVESWENNEKDGNKVRGIEVMKISPLKKMLQSSGQYKNCISLLSSNSKTSEVAANRRQNNRKSMIIQDSRSSESFKKMWSLMLSTLPEGITSFHATYILDMLYLIEENYDPLCKGQNIELKTLVSNPNTSFDIQEWAQIYAPMILEKICSRFHFQQLQHQQLQQSSFDLILRKDIKEGEDIKNRSKDDEDKDAADQTKLNIEAQETEEGTSFIEAA